MKPLNDPPRLLNVGCGRCFHPAWTNIDLVACSPEVRQYDLRRGLPYDDDTFDGVYHSHVLEHLTPEAAPFMLGECRRVLKPSGVMRVVVPDLEGIARAYLASIEAVERDENEMTIANHQWMTLELVDQMTRQRGGGRMGPMMRSADQINRDFIRGRLGHETQGNAKVQRRKTIGMRMSRLVADVRKSLATAAVRIIDGQSGAAAYREGRFRNSGEIHRWMYDRISLAGLLVELGFESPRVCRSDQSRIPGFDDFQLDRDGETARKPDSLYLEAVKPSEAIGSGTAPESNAIESNDIAIAPVRAAAAAASVGFLFRWV